MERCGPRSALEFALEFALAVFLPELIWMSGQVLHFLFSSECAGPGVSALWVGCQWAPASVNEV